MCMLCHRIRPVVPKKGSAGPMQQWGEAWLFKGSPNSGSCFPWNWHWMGAVPTLGEWPWQGDSPLSLAEVCSHRGFSWESSAANTSETGECMSPGCRRTCRTLRASGWMSRQASGHGTWENMWVQDPRTSKLGWLCSSRVQSLLWAELLLESFWKLFGLESPQTQVCTSLQPQ